MESWKGGYRSVLFCTVLRYFFMVLVTLVDPMFFLGIDFSRCAGVETTTELKSKWQTCLYRSWLAVADCSCDSCLAAEVAVSRPDPSVVGMGRAEKEVHVRKTGGVAWGGGGEVGSADVIIVSSTPENWKEGHTFVNKLK